MPFNRQLGLCLRPVVLFGSLGAPFRSLGDQSGRAGPAGAALLGQGRRGVPRCKDDTFGGHEWKA
jgi:hypothetical protein